MPADNMQAYSSPIWRSALGIVLTSLLMAAYARGAWPLGFVAWVPWLLSLNTLSSLRATWLSGALMSFGLVLAAFSWFGEAVAGYVDLPAFAGLLLICLIAPVLQFQVWVFALVRWVLARELGVMAVATASAAAWVACEWLLPKVLGDTLGHGLAPSTELRQFADLAGTAGLTLMLLLVNQSLAAALQAWRRGTRAWLPPLLVCLALPGLMWGYGQVRLTELSVQLSGETPVLRVGMVQTSIVDYERLRQELGSYAVVRQVLDSHFELSAGAIEQHGVDALLWAETVYPTRFNQPRNEEGAALDREIREFVAATGVSLVFGTYDLDDDGEYNAAAFLQPNGDLLGFYRKTRLFPLTEKVPDWLDGPLLRRWLPWAGTWRAGDGARVLPLRATDGRALQVVPLICLDDVDPSLAIDGARLGAQAIVSMSNDSWFSSGAMGAQLHLAVASFRSVETRLPQLRVTNNGYSAFIDPAGEILALTAIGDRAVLAGGVPVRDPPSTLMVRWGDWLGPLALAALLLLAPLLLLRARGRRRSAMPHATASEVEQSFDVLLLSAVARWAMFGLRSFAALGLLGLFLRMLQGDGLQVNALWQLQWYLIAVVLPLVLAWCLAQIASGRAMLSGRSLVIQQRGHRIELDVQQIATMRAWRWPWSGPLLSPVMAIEFVSGRRWDKCVLLVDPNRALAALRSAGISVALESMPQGVREWLQQRAASRRAWLDHGLLKFGLFPLIPALPAFRLHQYIAYGGTFGEYYTYGLQAWLLGLVIWWASWSIGLMLFAAALRLLIELLSGLALFALPQQSPLLRTALEWSGRAVFYLGVPLWLLWRVLAG